MAGRTRSRAGHRDPHRRRRLAPRPLHRQPFEPRPARGPRAARTLGPALPPARGDHLRIPRELSRADRHRRPGRRVRLAAPGVRSLRRPRGAAMSLVAFQTAIARMTAEPAYTIAIRADPARLDA